MNYPVDVYHIDSITPILNSLSEKEITKSMRAGARSIARLGVREIKKSYKRNIPRHNPKRKYGDPSKDIKGWVKSNKVDVKFSIMPSGGNDSGGFKLRWIEKGTQKRQTRKYKKTKQQLNRGIFKAKPFFEPTVERLRGQIKEMYEKAFIDAIHKLVKRKQK
jgi:hypothetical protein